MGYVQGRVDHREFVWLVEGAVKVSLDDLIQWAKREGLNSLPETLPQNVRLRIRQELEKQQVPF